ncbi:DUF3667 domain-containing protein [Litoribaculum gwangyangense]|uniref:DUF3667 domain-containing protein n=1 Tax=Litoribaculum gwangyangense TaxID=1130722 RepID=A0ABP9CD65_9FLAO
MEKKTLNCANCEKEFEDGFEFCPHCGQKTNEDLTLGVLFYNTISNYFSFDARFFKSFIPLMLKPGYLAQKFLEGKRLLFLHPAQMYLFISVIFFFVISFSVQEFASKTDAALKKDFDNSETSDHYLDTNKVKLDSAEIAKLMKPLNDNKQFIGLKDEDLKKADSLIKMDTKKSKGIITSFDFNQKSVDSLIASGAEDSLIYKEMGLTEDAGFFKRKFYEQMLKFYKNRGLSPIINTFFNSIPIAMFFLLPLFAFLLKVFYFKKGTYAHHLVFSFYYFSFLFMVFSLIFGINRFWDIPDWIDWFIALSTFIYLFIAIKRFYRQHWFLSLFKSGVISFVFLMLVMPLAFIILTGFSFLFY